MINNNNKSYKYNSKNNLKALIKKKKKLNLIQILFKEILFTTNEEKLDNFELNNLDYDKAINRDKRKFFGKYIVLY